MKFVLILHLVPEKPNENLTGNFMTLLKYVRSMVMSCHELHVVIRALLTVLFVLFLYFYFLTVEHLYYFLFHICTVTCPGTSEVS